MNKHTLTINHSTARIINDALAQQYYALIDERTKAQDCLPLRTLESSRAALEQHIEILDAEIADVYHEMQNVRNCCGLRAASANNIKDLVIAQKPYRA